MYLIFLLLVFTIILSIVFWTLLNRISPMPTSPKVKRMLLESLPPTVHGTVFELGSGWATLAIPLAQKYPHSRVVGFETSPLPYLYSKMLLSFYRLPNLHIVRKDFFTIPLHEAGFVVCYLYPDAMQRLREKFEQELPDHAQVVSHTFAIPGWIPTKTIEVNDLYKSKIYFYTLWSASGRPKKATLSAALS